MVLGKRKSYFSSFQPQNVPSLFEGNPPNPPTPPPPPPLPPPHTPPPSGFLEFYAFGFNNGLDNLKITPPSLPQLLAVFSVASGLNVHFLSFRPPPLGIHKEPAGLTASPWSSLHLIITGTAGGRFVTWYFSFGVLGKPSPLSSTLITSVQVLPFLPLPRGCMITYRQQSPDWLTASRTYPFEPSIPLFVAFVSFTESLLF